jgi:hypothetical protein
MVAVDRSTGVNIFKEGKRLAVVGGTLLDAWLRRRAEGNSESQCPI